MIKKKEKLIGKIFLISFFLLCSGVLLIFIYGQYYDIDKEFSHPSSLMSQISKFLIIILFSQFILLMSYIFLRIGIERFKEGREEKISKIFALIIVFIAMLSASIKVTLHDLKSIFSLEFILLITAYLFTSVIFINIVFIFINVKKNKKNIDI
ncbi:MAG: hypothetical protein JSV49_03675 [Thermoplasmata archaeon]|nr:MAG: hypothetical protein JSV49_03675 [Thermoplasmata archaeon]